MLGALAMAMMAEGLFFLRFWWKTADRFFLPFAIAFWVMAINRILLALTGALQEDTPFFYLVRLAAYLPILTAIVDKNLAARRS